MKILLLILLFFIGICLSSNNMARELNNNEKGLIPKFAFKENEIELSRNVQQAKYCESIGRRAAILGYEQGIFEVWVYPLKILHDLQLSFNIRGLTQPIKGSQLAEYIAVKPEATTITYAHASFTVKQTIFVPIDKQGAIILLDIDCYEPLTLFVNFFADLKPMWPAGLGGQFSYWDDAAHAFVISESRWKFGAMIGSPIAVQYSSGPAHRLPDNPTQFKIEIDPKVAYQYFVPIVIAGGVDGMEKVRETYEELLTSVTELYQENVSYYRRLREELLSVETPNKELNLAFEWSKVAIDKGFACNPWLGCGMVAGFGTSGRSERPGFAWFFGGDACMSCWAINSYGDFNIARQALTLLRNNQRNDGKVMHELSQSAGLIKWFEEYPYGYYHADTSPYYILAMYDYYLVSGDLKFLKESWKSIKRAYQYCLSTETDGDGLMENTKAGVAASELGKLRGKRVLVDIYLAGVWTQALKAIADMATVMGEAKLRAQSLELYEKACSTINEKFWDPNKKMFAFGILQGGGRVNEVTPWQAVPMVFDLLEPQKASHMLNRIASSEISTDWGVRYLSNKSKFYEPLHYNQGAVWPFLTGFVAWAEYRYHRGIAGFTHLMNIARLTFVDALGFATELLSGDLYKSIDTAVPHQLFSSAMFVTAVVRGLLGLKGNAVERVVKFAPHLPAKWNELNISNFWVGDDRFNFKLKRQSNKLTLLAVRSASIKKDNSQYQLQFSQAFGLGTKIIGVLVNGKRVKFQSIPTGHDIHCQINIPINKETIVEIEFNPGIEAEPLERQPKIGDRTSSLKIIDTALDGNEFRVTAEGISGSSYRLGLRTSFPVLSISGAQIVSDTNSYKEIEMTFPKKNSREYVKKIVKIKLKL